MRIRPGDLAISIHTQHPENNGLIVQVVHPFAWTDEWPMAEKSWWCTCAQPMTWKVNGRFVKALAGPVPEACLFPIRGTGGDAPGSRAKRTSLKVRPNWPCASPGPVDPTPATKTLPATAPEQAEEVADAVPA